MSAELGLAAAFLVGLLGSVHCLGMCSGIAGLAGATGQAASPGGRLRRVLAYNLGRIFSYALVGLAVGALGDGVYRLLPQARFSDLGMLVSGVFLVALGAYLAGWWQGLAKLEVIGGHAWTALRPLAARLLPIRGPGRALAAGMLWGFLPCGLVYATLVLALSAADPLRSAALMLFFGLGTLPAMLAVGGLGDQLAHWRTRPGVRRAVGVVVIVFGLVTFFGGGPWHAHHAHPAGTDHAGHAQHGA